MPLSVRQLLNPPTSAQIQQTILGFLSDVGFKVTSWQEGSVQRNIIEAVADTTPVGVIADIVAQTITNPRGAWLDLVGQYRYGLTRLRAIPAERVATFASVPSAPLTVIPAGAYVTVGTTRFRTLAAASVPSGGSDAVAVAAEFGGVAGNTTKPAKIVGYPGVSVSLETPAVNGTDDELDDRYQARLDRRFSELTYSVSLRAYELWALTAAPSVRRAKAINNYPTENAIRVVIDPGEPSEIAQVEAYIAGRSPPNDDVTVVAASVVDQLFTLRPRVLAGTTVESITELIDAVLLTMPIGGWPIAGAPAGRLLREKITEPLICAQGAQSAGLQFPTADVVLGGSDVVHGIYDIETETAL